MVLRFPCGGHRRICSIGSANPNVQTATLYSPTNLLQPWPVIVGGNAGVLGFAVSGHPLDLYSDVQWNT